MSATLNGFAIDDLDLALTHSGSALDGLLGATLLLTGGTGFIGQWILATLLHGNRTRQLGLTIILPTRNAEAFRARSPELASDDAVRLIESDIRTLDLQGLRPTHIIHAATDTSVEADANPLLLMDTIVNGTRRVLDIAVETGARDVLYVSSGAVYGAQGEIEHVAETERIACDPLDRRSVYGESKRLAEMLCAVYGNQHGLRPRIARCFAFVGPGMPLDAHFAIGNFIADAVAGRPVTISGDGTPIRSYLYAGDLVAWLLRMLANGRPGVAYNVGSGEAFSLKEIAEIVAAAVPTATGVDVRGTPQPGAFRSRYAPSVERAQTELGVEVWTSLPDAVRATAAWAAQAPCRQPGERVR
ncbi:MAG: NAD-dependent epimerase/dehydratase family protein [Hyphomicrobium sp.]